MRGFVRGPNERGVTSVPCVTHVIIASEIGSTCSLILLFNSDMARGRPRTAGTARKAGKAKSESNGELITSEQWAKMKSFGTFVGELFREARGTSLVSTCSINCPFLCFIL